MLFSSRPLIFVLLLLSVSASRAVATPLDGLKNLCQWATGVLSGGAAAGRLARLSPTPRVATVYRRLPGEELYFAPDGRPVGSTTRMSEGELWYFGPDGRSIGHSLDMSLVEPGVTYYYDAKGLRRGHSLRFLDGETKFYPEPPRPGSAGGEIVVPASLGDPQKRRRELASAALQLLDPGVFTQAVPADDILPEAMGPLRDYVTTPEAGVVYRGRTGSMLRQSNAAAGEPAGSITLSAVLPVISAPGEREVMLDAENDLKLPREYLRFALPASDLPKLVSGYRHREELPPATHYDSRSPNLVTRSQEVWVQGDLLYLVIEEHETTRSEDGFPSRELRAGRTVWVMPNTGFSGNVPWIEQREESPPLGGTGWEVTSARRFGTIPGGRALPPDPH